MTQQNLGNAIFTLDVQDAEFNRKLGDAEAASGRVGSSFGRTAGNIGKAAAGLAVAAVGLAGPFQDTADRIRQSIATGTGAAGASLDRLTNQVRQVAGQWGSDWAAAGDVVAAVANIPTTSPMQEQQILALTASFQRAGFEANNVALTVNVAAETMGTSIMEAADVVAFFATQSQATGVSADVMSAAFRRAAEDANILGFSASDTGALIANAAANGGAALVTRLAPALQAVVEQASRSDLTAEMFSDTLADLFALISEGADASNPRVAALAAQLDLTATVTNDLAAATRGLNDDQIDALLTSNETWSALEGTANRLVIQNMETLTATERWQGLRNTASGFIQEQLVNLPEWAQLATAAGNDVLGVMMSASTAILLAAQNTTIMTAATRAFGVVTQIVGTILRVVTTTALGPIGIAIAALAALALVVITNWTTFRDIFLAIWDVVRASVASAIDFVIGLINRAIQQINRLIDSVNRVSSAVGGPTIGRLSELVFDTGIISGGQTASEAAAALFNTVRNVDLGEVLSNATAGIGSLFGGGDAAGDAQLDALADVIANTPTPAVAELAQAAESLRTIAGNFDDDDDFTASPALRMRGQREQFDDDEDFLNEGRTVPVIETDPDTGETTVTTRRSRGPRPSRAPRIPAARLPSGFGGSGACCPGTTVNITIQGDILESEATNNRIVSEIERAVVRGKLPGMATGNAIGSGGGGCR